MRLRRRARNARRWVWAWLVAKLTRVPDGLPFCGVPGWMDWWAKDARRKEWR